MNHNKKSGPCYSNVSLIKKVLYQSKNGTLPLPDIVFYIQLNWNHQSNNGLSSEKLVQMALYAPKSFFQEDENGLWKIKKHIDKNLDLIIDYIRKLHRPFQSKEVFKKFNEVNDDIKMFEQDLLSDIRFTQIQDTPYWMLSEWELMNDLVYEYLQKNKVEFIKQEEVITIVVDEYGLDESITLFAPQIDKRFSTKGKYINITLEVQESDMTSIVSVPEEIIEEVARKSVEILRLFHSNSGEIKTSDLIPQIFNTKANDSKFAVYFKAIEEFLSSLPELSCLTTGRWIINQSAAAIELETKTPGWKYAVYGSVPLIKNINELKQLEQQQAIKTASDSSYEVKGNKKENEQKEVGYHTLSYYERIKGYFNVPKELIPRLLNKNQNIGLISAELEGFKYEWLWRVQDEYYYFYGDGVIDFFSDYLLEVGQKLKLLWLNENSVNIDLLELDERYASEQNRYLDIGRLVEESRSINKSIYTIMCEVLATYPSGMHWTLLLDKVSEVRSTTKNTVYNLLRKNDCFEPVNDKKGYWRLNISKLSRYYVDEADQQVEENYTYTIEEELLKIRQEDNEVFDEDEHKEQINEVKEVNKVENKKSHEDPYDWNKEFELDPLWEMFSTWASKQQSLWFQTAEEKSANKKELIELLTAAYSKLLVRMAKSRNFYSIDHMDLVQEGFFGLLKAIDTYDPSLGKSFAHHVRRWVLSKISRYIADFKNLIRIPVHMVELINKYEKLVSEVLLLKGRMPNENELLEAGITNNHINTVQLYSKLHNIDFISFEQVWTYQKSIIERDTSEEVVSIIRPWTIAQFIDDKNNNIVYSKNDHELVTELEYLTYILEQDTEVFWDNSMEQQIFMNDLKTKLDDLMDNVSEGEEVVIRLRYGLDDGRERTLEEVGKVLGVTRERIRQIEKKALSKLKIAARKNELEIYIFEEKDEPKMNKSVETEPEADEDANENNEMSQHNEEIFNVVLLKSEIRKTLKSSMVYVEIKISEEYALEITEYGGFITAVIVRNLKINTVVYKSEKDSIQDALIAMKYTEEQIKQIKQQIVLLRKKVKAAGNATTIEIKGFNVPDVPPKRTEVKTQFFNQDEILERQKTNTNFLMQKNKNEDEGFSEKSNNQSSKIKLEEAIVEEENKLDKKLDLTNYLISKGLKIVDNRKSGGALWAIGGIEYSKIFEQLTSIGIVFRFSSNGGRSTKHKPAWWTKDEPDIVTLNKVNNVESIISKNAPKG